MTYKDKVSALVPSWFPEFVREQGPNFVEFMKGYIEWAEREGGTIDALTSALDNKDIDLTLDRIVDAFHKEFMPSMPRSVLADRRLIIKHIRDFLRSRGSQKSVRFLFRVLFNEEIEFYYPGRDILRVSGAKWVIDKTITMTGLTDPQTITAIRGERVRGSNSGASALVERIDATMQNRRVVYVLLLSSIRGTFSAGEYISADGEIVGLVQSFTVHPGRYVGTDGFLDSNKYLQGPHYYQEYSYVLKTGQPLSRYEGVVRQLVHPAGTKLFGQIDMQMVMPEVDMTILAGGSYNHLELLSETVDLVPTLITGVGFEEEEAGAVFQIETTFAAEAELEMILSRLVAITGTVTTANISTPASIANEPVSNYAHWTPLDFTNGRGLIGTGTDFVTKGVSPDQLVIIDDGTESIAEVEYADSNTTMVLKRDFRTVTGATVHVEVTT